MSGLGCETFGQVDNLDGLKWALSNALTTTDTKHLRYEADFTRFSYFNANLSLLI